MTAFATQALANRANAQLSTGPRTEEGKRVSSQNSITDGLSAAQFANIISLMEITGKARNLGAGVWVSRWQFFRVPRLLLPASSFSAAPTPRPERVPVRRAGRVF